eukprot:6295844-Pyramimonas_sp.AAC.1
MTDVEKGTPDEKTKLKDDGKKKDGGCCCKPVASLVWLVFFIILLVSFAGSPNSLIFNENVGVFSRIGTVFSRQKRSKRMAPDPECVNPPWVHSLADRQDNWPLLPLPVSGYVGQHGHVAYQ